MKSFKFAGDGHSVVYSLSNSVLVVGEMAYFLLLETYHVLRSLHFEERGS